MFRVSVAALLVLVSAASAGCADNILKERPAARVTGTAGPKPTFAAAGSARGESSTCSAYRRQLRVIQLRLLTQSGSAQATELKGKELSLNAIIADACE